MPAVACTADVAEKPCGVKTTAKSGLCATHRALASQAEDDAERLRPAANLFQRVRVGKPYNRRVGWDDFRYYPVTTMLPDGGIESQRESQSVTTVLQHSVPKPALVHWAAKVEREYVLDQVAEVVSTMRRAGVKAGKDQDVGAFVRQLVLEKCGERYAHRMKLKTAGEIGTAMHGWIDWHHRGAMSLARGDEPKLMDEAMNAVSAYLDLEKQYAIEPIASEERVASVEFGFAGAIDTRAWATHPELGRVRVIIDYKSGKAVYDEAKLQIAAYALAHNELCDMHGAADMRTQAGLIFRLPKVVGDPMPEVVWVTELDDWADKFLACLYQYNALIGDRPLEG